MPDTDAVLRFTVLGPVRAWRNDTEVQLGSPGQRALLALLLAAAGRPLGISELIAALWPDEPPATAPNVIRQYVGGLRRRFEPGLARRDQGRWLLLGAGGYRIAVTTDDLDLLRLRGLLASAESAEAYATGLELWQGPVAADAPQRLRSHPVFAAIELELSTAVRAAADIALAEGAADRLLPTVRRAAGLHPFDEPLQARLVSLLAAAGQQAAALDHFRAVAGRLAAELGLDPGEELTAAREAVLRDDPDRPAQLPRDLPAFAGRAAELAEAMTLLDGATAPGPVVISAIGGMAGVGKTALAVHWAHRVADRFPDGQLYLNMRGFDPHDDTLDPARALQVLLGSLGAAPAEVPSGLDALSAAFRARMAGRRMLLLLDNAHDAEQVRPLLPGTPGCLVIVTSRVRLHGLITSGAVPLNLDVLSAADSRALLARRLGEPRVSAEPEAVETIVAHCARLPLALSMVAARAALNPAFPLAAIAEELHDTDRLDSLGDTQIVFSWSYRRLSAPAARLFRLLGVHPGPDVSTAAAASLTGVPPRDVRAPLAELVRNNLISEHRPGRYLIHDLLRAYANELLDPAEADPARRRVVDHYLHTALIGCHLMNPSYAVVELDPPAGGVTPEPITGGPQALAWFVAEEAVLFALIDATVRTGLDRATWQLQWALHPYMLRRLPTDTSFPVLRAAARALDRLGDLDNRARVEAAIATMYSMSGEQVGQAAGHRAERRSLAADHFRQALVMYGAAGNLSGQGNVLYGLALLANRTGDRAGTVANARRALGVYRRAGDDYGMASALGGISWAHAQHGNHRQAISRGRQALELLAGGRHRQAEASILHTVAYSHLRLDEPTAAAVSLHRAIDLAVEVGDPYLVAECQIDLGDAELAMGDPAAARHSWESALGVLEEFGTELADRTREKLKSLTP
ncbi:BTAD domain-containing putative transcriptional regulator [Actinoplanes sp. NPDC026670]|uniref:AfsR/SARP family transcriptional regulator n=1 Tax=Actinoplanes sp. NPDC026670 TaxID=3154700 RepID=UPI0033EB2999